MVMITREYPLLRTNNIDEYDLSDPSEVMTYLTKGMDEMEIDRHAASLLIVRMHQVQRRLGQETLIEKRHGIKCAPLPERQPETVRLFERTEKVAA